MPKNRALESYGPATEGYTKLTTNGAIDGGDSKGQESDELELHDGREDPPRPNEGGFCLCDPALCRKG